METIERKQMRKKSTIITAIICCCIFITSCNDTKTIGYERDKSLAGSISFVGYKMEAEGLYSEIVLENFQYGLSHLDIRKVSDTEVSFFCFSKWGETTLKVDIPLIIVSGKPHDATFDYSSNDATVTYNNIEHTPIRATINGWIKETNVQQSSNNKGSSDPATPHYTCEIIINCNIDGKALNLKITSVKPY